MTNMISSEAMFFYRLALFLGFPSIITELLVPKIKTEGALGDQIKMIARGKEIVYQRHRTKEQE